MRIPSGCMLLVLSALGTALGQDTNFPSGPQYLMNSNLMKSGSLLFARPISTPSMSLAGPPLEVGASDATGVLIAGAVDQNVLPPNPAALPKIDLLPIYYGRPPASVIEISLPSEPSSNPLPASILDTGVWQVTTAHALRERGYGVTLAAGAAYAKAQTRHATRVYTNADIDRLHSGI
ncbi:MAG: hypothetical protein WCA20_28605 [Candidatus Sulfotelmatobacter sp.]